MKLRKGQTIKFTAMDEFTGQEVKLTGVVVGDYKKIKKNYPIEMGEVDKNSDLYLIKVPNRNGNFVVHTSEIIEVIK